MYVTYIRIKKRYLEIALRMRLYFLSYYICRSELGWTTKVIPSNIGVSASDGFAHTSTLQAPERRMHEKLQFRATCTNNRVRQQMFDSFFMRLILVETFQSISFKKLTVLGYIDHRAML